MRLPTVHSSDIAHVLPLGPTAVTGATGNPGLLRELQAWKDVLDTETGEGKYLGPEEADRWASAVSRWVIDASLLADTASLEAGFEVLRSAHGRLRGDETARLNALVMLLAETTRAGLDRARQYRVAEALDPNTRAAQMLLLMAGTPGITSSEMSSQLHAADTQISRSGTALIERGLAVKTRHGRERSWRLSPRGEIAVERLQSKTRTSQ